MILPFMRHMMSREDRSDNAQTMFTILFDARNARRGQGVESDSPVEKPVDELPSFLYNRNDSRTKTTNRRSGTVRHLGGKDIAEKTLEAYNEVFADIVNVLLFDGKQR